MFSFAFFVGILLYQLIASDDEGDIIKFELHDDKIQLGDLNMTSDG